MTTLTRPIPDAVLEILAVIRNVGVSARSGDIAGARPMLVGGYVREDLLGRASKDVDIEVYDLPDFERLAYALAEAGYQVNAVGVSFGVLKARAATWKQDGTDLEFDISLPRRDSKTGEGHRGFTVIPDSGLGFAEASARRDFTINSMLADPDTREITDFHGGQADLRAGILRHTSPAFSEDPLRVLRGVKFAARFGFRMTPATTALCQRLAGQYGLLAKERVWGEFRNIGDAGVNITAALQVLADTGWEEHFPQIAGLHGIRQDPRWHPEGDVHVHSGLAADQAARLADEADLAGNDRLVVVMAALCHDMGKATHTRRAGSGWRLLNAALPGHRFPITCHGHAEAGVAPARAFLAAAGCPWSLVDRITPLVREHMNCLARPTQPAVRRLARRLAEGNGDGPATVAELILVIAADNAGRGDPDAPNPAQAWLDMARTLTVTQRPRRGLLTGYHLINAGMKPGPQFKKILAAALAAQDAGEFGNEYGAISWLGRWLAAHNEGDR